MFYENDTSAIVFSVYSDGNAESFYVNVTRRGRTIIERKET
jgi:hypothetical protein